MNAKQIQNLLKASGYYNGEIDGYLGVKSQVAINKIVDSHIKDMSKAWSKARRSIAAAQLILSFAGFPVGAIDGISGVKTQAAYSMWEVEVLNKTSLPLATDWKPDPKFPLVKGSFPKQSGCARFYGTPGTTTLTSQLKMFTLPLAMRLDWDLGTKVTRVQLHEKCGPSAISAIKETIRHYGETRWRGLGLDRNAGTYNHRKMTGGSSWSMHAYGCAWDFYAAPNAHATKSPKALFSQPAYEAFWKIWEAHGWTSLGRARDFDWMHVQAASL